MKHAELQEWRRTYRMEDQWWVLAGKAVLPEPRSLQEIAQLSGQVEQDFCVMHVKYAHTSQAKWIRYERDESAEAKTLPAFDPIPIESQKQRQQQYEKPRKQRIITEDQLKFIVANKLAPEEQARSMMRSEASTLIRNFNRKQQLVTTLKVLTILAVIIGASIYIYFDRRDKQQDILTTQQAVIDKAQAELDAFQTKEYPSTPLVDAIEAGKFSGMVERIRLAGKIDWSALNKIVKKPPKVHLLNEFTPEALKQTYHQNEILLALLKPAATPEALETELSQLKEHLPPPLKNVYDSPIPYIYSPFRPHSQTFLPKEAFEAEWAESALPDYEQFTNDFKPANLNTLSTAISTVRGKVQAKLKRLATQQEPTAEEIATIKWLENAMSPYLDMLSTFQKSSLINKMDSKQRTQQWNTYLDQTGKRLHQYIEQHTMFTVEAQPDGTYLIPSVKEEYLVAEFELDGYTAYFPNQGTQPASISIEQRQKIRAEASLNRQQIVLRVMEKVSHPAQRLTRTLPLGEQNIELVYEQDPRFYIVCNERNLNQVYLFKVPQWIYEKVTVGSNVLSADYDKLWLVPQIPKQEYPEGFN